MEQVGGNDIDVPVENEGCKEARGEGKRQDVRWSEGEEDEEGRANACVRAPLMLA
jgi:hypothetical protein